ncbi:MAG: hypothetical protein R6U50_07370 [Desulfobacterales bacterium]
MKLNIAVFAVTVSICFFAFDAHAVRFMFDPQLYVAEKYTDNVFLTEDDEEDDFITELSAGFTASLQTKTSGLELSAFPTYAWYSEFSENNSWRLPADLHLYTRPSQHTRIYFRDRFLRTEDPEGIQNLRVLQGRVEEIGDTTRRRGRENYYRNAAELGANHSFGRDDQVYSRFSYGILRNDDDELYEDNDYYRAGAGLDYWLTHMFGLQSYLEYTKGDYETPDDFVDNTSDDFDNYRGTIRLLGRLTRHSSFFLQYEHIYREFSDDSEDYAIYAPSAGYYYEFDRDTFVRLGLGFYYQDRENDGSEEEFFLEGELSKTWDYRRGYINLTGLSGLTQNDFGAQTPGFQRFAAIDGEGEYRFTRRFAGYIGSYLRYSETPLVTGTGDEDEQTGQGIFSVDVRYLVTPWMLLSAGYAFSYYESDVYEDYRENRGLLAVSFQPGRTRDISGADIDRPFRRFRF